MFTETSDESLNLSHYGVLGMKWGVRKDGKPQGFQYGKKGEKSRERAARKEKKKEYRKKAKNRSLLSDQDLDYTISRLKKERQIKELAREETKPGYNFVRSVIASPGTKKALGAAVTGAVIFAGKNFVSGFFDEKEKKITMDDLIEPSRLFKDPDKLKRASNIAREASNYIFPNPNKKK